MSAVNELSAQAQELIRLTFDGHENPLEGVKLSQVLAEHPELMSGLDEYVAWRDERLRAVAQIDTTPSVGHSTSGVLAKAVTSSTKPTGK